MIFYKTTEKQKSDITKDIQAGSILNWSYLIMNILATVIACYGLLANSPAVVIGAMIVAMLLGPILGISLALVESDRNLLKNGFITLIAGAIGVFSVAFVLGIIHQDIPLTNEIIARTSPNLIDLFIALAGGAAGAYATVSPRLSIAFVGVAIATALVPPLSSSGILFARGEYSMGFGALLLTFTNIIAIQFAASVVLWFTGFRQVTQKTDNGLQVFLKRNFVSLGILLLLGIILTQNLHAVLSKQLFESKTRGILLHEISAIPGNYLVEVRFEKHNQLILIRTVVRGPKEPNASQVAQMEKMLPQSPDRKPIELRVRFIQTSIIDRNGYLYKDADLYTHN